MAAERDAKSDSMTVGRMVPMMVELMDWLKGD